MYTWITNKHKAILCGIKCSGISYNDIDNAGRNNMLVPENISLANYQF